MKWFHPPTAVFLGAFAVFMANGRPHPEIDCVAAPYTAWSLVRHGNYDLREYRTLDKHPIGCWYQLPDGTRVSMRTPGSAILMVPVIAPFAATRAEPFRDLDMNQLGKVASSLAMAFAAMVFFRMCREHTPRAAWPATILFALGTCLWSVVSQAIWVHAPAVLGLTVGLWLLLKEDLRSLTLPARRVVGWRYFLIGFSLGFATFSRPTTAIFPIVTVGTLLLQRRWKEALFTCLGGVLPAALLMHYHWVYFGNLLKGGYAQDNFTTAPPLWLGLGGLLVAPSRGLFIYSPALLLIFPGVWWLVRTAFAPSSPTPLPPRERGLSKLALAWMFAALVTLFMFARWHDWRGGWCYGPRFSAEALPILCFTFAVAYQHLQRRWMRITTCVLVGISVAVQAIGILGYADYEGWQQRHDEGLRHDGGRCLFELHDTQIEAHAHGAWKKLTGKK